MEKQILKSIINNYHINSDISQISVKPIEQYPHVFRIQYPGGTLIAKRVDKSKLYCIMGKSGSGKDTILERLLHMRNDLTPIMTYTTRPQRPGEKNGKEYYFVTPQVFEKLKNNDSVIEYRRYNTTQGEWIYFMADDNQIDEKSDKKYIVINTIFGVRKLREKYGTNVIPIHLWINDISVVLKSKKEKDKSKRRTKFQFVQLYNIQVNSMRSRSYKLIVK